MEKRLIIKRRGNAANTEATEPARAPVAPMKRQYSFSYRNATHDADGKVVPYGDVKQFVTTDRTIAAKLQAAVDDQKGAELVFID